MILTPIHNGNRAPAWLELDLFDLMVMIFEI